MTFMDTARPRALVITTAGTNCDRELAIAFDRAGAAAERVHLNQLLDQPDLIDTYDLIGLPGGFSYGDAIAAGRIKAQLMRKTLYQPLIRAVQRGVPIIAPCNGFQVAVQMGLLPGPAAGEPWPDMPAPPRVALVNNESARFIDTWTRIDIPTDTRCVWTRGIDLSGPAAMLPSAHGEGRFVAEDSALIDDLFARGQVAVTYAEDDNPNGSTRHIAGICDASGLVFGLMPHPERYTQWTHHPFWSRLRDEERTGDPPGLQMFRNAVRAAMQVNA